jgi:hypothetical protein
VLGFVTLDGKWQADMGEVFHSETRCAKILLKNEHFNLGGNECVQLKGDGIMRV